jgi:hypothetical protein
MGNSLLDGGSPLLRVSAAVRLASALLMTSMAFALVGCGSDAEPLPIEQRFATAEDAPGTQS